MATAERTSKPKRVVMPADQARQQLGDVIDRAGLQGGERFVLTRHKKELVAVVSMADLERLEKIEAVA